MNEYTVILLLFGIIILLVAVLALILKEFFKQRNFSERRRKQPPIKKIIIISLVAVAVFLLIYFIPRGRNSIWAEAGDSQAEILGGGDTDSKDESDGIMTVYVKGDMVTVNGKSFKVTETDDEGFEAYVSKLDLLGVSVRVKENYATAYAYHYAEDVLIMSGASVIGEKAE